MTLNRWWPLALALVGALIGAVAAVQIPAQGAARLLVIAVWQAMGGSIAATLVLLVTAIERVVGDGLTIATSRVPRALAVVTGAGVAVGVVIMLALASVEPGAGAPVLMMASLALVAVALVRPLAVAVGPLALLVASVALVEIPRELGVLDVHWSWSHTTTHRDDDTHAHCEGNDWPGAMKVAAVARGWRIEPRLGGNVGEQLTYEERPAANGELTVVFEGDVDVGWAECLIPLYKPVTVDADLDVRFRVEAAEGTATASCDGNGTARLHVELTTTGFSSCHHVREELADALRAQLAAFARGVAGG
jgi:hypothetical protein